MYVDGARGGILVSMAHLNTIRVGLYLAVRYIVRANVWSTVLIVFIMLLTFLNVVFVRGVLIGIPIGASEAYEQQYAGDVIVGKFADKTYIDRGKYIETIITNTPGYAAHSYRFVTSGTAEANYKESRREDELPDIVGVPIAGIDPEHENTVTGLRDLVVEGEYLHLGSDDEILIGSQNIDRYNLGPLGEEALEDVFPGSKVRISIAGNTREFTVVGVVKSKIGDVSRRVYMSDTIVRKMLGRYDYNPGEIAIRTTDAMKPETFRNALLASGIGEYAKVETASESQGQFLQDITDTFDILSTVIGLIGLVVAAITVFIVIFINAISRQKQIGILKGIGMSNASIELSYVFLSMFYALVGTVLGLVLLYTFLEPYFDVNPIDFPFSDGKLIAPLGETLWRSGLILAATVIAGYIPSRIIVQKNTINAILGR